MGVSPYDTAYSLWQRKMGLSPDKQQTSCMKRGHDLEDLARQRFYEMTGFKVTPKVFTHPGYSFLMASMDGITEDLQVAVEIKCNGKINHKLALEGKIPDHYNYQLQHQMFVCELNWMYYFSFDGQSGILVIVGREETTIKKLIIKELEFYRCMLEVEPPKMTDKDFQVRKDVYWKEVSKHFLNVRSQLKELEKEQERLKIILLNLSENRPAIGCGIRLSKIIHKGAIDYKKIPELITVNLDEYRGDPVISWKITETKEDDE
jgi:putative phage-type endonuclease